MRKSLGRDIKIPLYLDSRRAARAADVLKALAHPIRLRLVRLLCEGNRNVSELSRILELKQSIVSQQLAILRRERLVAAVRVGGMAVYHLAEAHLHDVIHCLESCALP
jgi:DNA-binding transcriptional ArsR family regulator